MKKVQSSLRLIKKNTKNTLFSLSNKMKENFLYNFPLEKMKIQKYRVRLHLIKKKKTRPTA